MAVDYLSALNVGSGLNVTQIVDAIIDAERVPRENQLNKRIDERTVSISALGEVKTEVKTFKDNLEFLETTNTNGLVVGSSDEAVGIEGEIPGDRRADGKAPDLHEGAHPVGNRVENDRHPDMRTAMQGVGKGKKRCRGHAVASIVRCAGKHFTGPARQHLNYDQ